MHEPISTLIYASLAALFIGLSKAGFGGGLGMLTTPLCVLAFSSQGKPPTYAVGILLPLLCVADAFSLYHYWGKWRRDNLKFLLPGVLVGVMVGVRLMGNFSSRQLNIVIGLLALFFVGFQLVRSRLLRKKGEFIPSHSTGWACGLGAGVTSTFAHGAGPVVSVFLIPQNMAKEIYIGTTALVFTCINWIKMPFFCLDQTHINLPLFLPQAIITSETLLRSLLFLPLIPVGVWLGVALNRRFSEALFRRFVYGTTCLTGLQLIFNFNLARFFP